MQALAPALVVLCSLPLLALTYVFFMLYSRSGDTLSGVITLALLVSCGLVCCARQSGAVIVAAIAGTAAIGVFVWFACLLLGALGSRI